MDSLAPDPERGSPPPAIPTNPTAPSANGSSSNGSYSSLSPKPVEAKVEQHQDITSPPVSQPNATVVAPKDNQSANVPNVDAPSQSLPKQNSTLPSLPVTTNAPQAKPNIDLTVLTSALLNIVSDKTGYPAEMLDLTMDIEADLGIDSIKRVEILGAMQDAFPELPSIHPEELMELRSLAEIAEYMGGWESTPKKHPVSP